MACLEGGCRGTSQMEEMSRDRGPPTHSDSGHRTAGVDSLRSVNPACSSGPGAGARGSLPARRPSMHRGCLLVGKMITVRPDPHSPSSLLSSPPSPLLSLSPLHSLFLRPLADMAAASIRHIAGSRSGNRVPSLWVSVFPYFRISCSI